jgi:hypothetical protein
MTIDPTQAAPLTISPTTDAGNPPIMTVATPGPVIVSPVAVISVTLAAGKLIFISSKKLSLEQFIS